MTNPHNQRAHALLSASGASRWMACTPSARLEDGFAEVESGFAQEGTLAHEWAENGLRLLFGRHSATEALKIKQQLKMSEHYSEELPEEVDKYVQYVAAQFREAKRLNPYAMLFIEQKIDLTDYIEDGFGTSDAVIVSDGVLEVIDLKYGKGVRVDAERNKQAMLYGLGALRYNEMLYEIHTVRLTIVQPRLDHITSWDINADMLGLWGAAEVIPLAQKAFAGEGEFVPGDHCRFCKARPKCRALAEMNLAAVREDFKEPALLTDEETIDIFKKAPGIENWLGAVSAHVLQTALDGKQWPEHKLVEGRSNRTITNEVRAALALAAENFTEEQIYNKKLKGIGDLEKLAGKPKFEKLVGPYVAKPAGKPTLVLESDKRQALRLTAAADFGVTDKNELL